jgi:starch synthase (maltosyl-transferring)
MFQARLVLAATLSSSYGIYGPAFELMEHVPREPGMEEYLDSEKYQVRHWDLGRPDSLAPLIGRVNRIRRDHPALQSNAHLGFHEIEDDFALAYSKRTADATDVILTVVSLDPVYPRTSPVHLRADLLGLDLDEPFELEDLLGGSVLTWQGSRLDVSIDPAVCPARIFHVRPAGGRRPELESGS